MSIEKRLHPRILVEWPAEVKTLQGTIEGITKDISVDGEGSTGWDTCIAIDSNNKVHISYNDRVGNLKYATSALTPVISASPESLNFGNVNVGCTSAFQTLTISNKGLADLVIGTLSITGTDASEFNIHNDNCSGQTIAPSGTYTVDVAFSPTSLGLKSANLSVPSNDPSVPILNVPLRNSVKAMP
jgi:hypothetical protein